MIFIALVTGAALATEVGFILRPEVAIDVAADRPGEDMVESRTWIRGFAKGETEGGDRWFLEIQGEHQLYSGDDVEGWADVRPGESGWDGSFGPVEVRAGHLIERWGKLDLLPVADVINPRDLRAGPMTPPEFLRLPIPMVTVTAGSDVVRATTVLVPFAGVDRVETRGTDWSIVRQRMMRDFGNTAADWPDQAPESFEGQLRTLGRSLETQDSYMRRGLNVAVGQKDFPDALFFNGELAERVEISGPGFDVGLMAGNLRSNQAAGTLDQTFVDMLKARMLPSALEAEVLYDAMASIVVNEWPRTWMAGLDTSTVVGPVGLRAEGVWFSDRVVRSQYLQSTTSGSVGAGLGIDWSYGSTVFLAAEARLEQLLDPPRTVLLGKPQQITLAGTGRFSFAADKLRLQLVGAYDASFSEVMLRPQLIWRPSDPVEMSVGAVILGGPTDPPGGLIEAITYTGGPGSYFSQNDAVTLGFAWIR